LGVADLDEASVGAFLARPTRRRWKQRSSARAGLQQFLEHLRIGGVVPRCRAEPPPGKCSCGGFLTVLIARPVARAIPATPP